MVPVRVAVPLLSARPVAMMRGVEATTSTTGSLDWKPGAVTVTVPPGSKVLIAARARVGRAAMVSGVGGVIVAVVSAAGARAGGALVGGGRVVIDGVVVDGPVVATGVVVMGASGSGVAAPGVDVAG